MISKYVSEINLLGVTISQKVILQGRFQGHKNIFFKKKYHKQRDFMLFYGILCSNLCRFKLFYGIYDAQINTVLSSFLIFYDEMYAHLSSKFMLIYVQNLCFLHYLL